MNPTTQIQASPGVASPLGARVNVDKLDRLRETRRTLHMLYQSLSADLPDLDLDVTRLRSALARTEYQAELVRPMRNADGVVIASVDTAILEARHLLAQAEIRRDRVYARRNDITEHFQAVARVTDQCEDWLRSNPIPTAAYGVHVSTAMPGDSLPHLTRTAIALNGGSK